ncbi:olfactory receptor 6N1-like [Emydura macquarii macquarii]|uniref:olfactory receptor 6N1-like n=1 Tax=Emydura macquarii macquarii TaxID=1129001 RepID=UPI00352A19C5
MADPEPGNQTSIIGFILLGFGNFHKLQILLFLLFLVIYVVTMAGNTAIVVLVVADQHLHTPMYFFLGNLSCLEACYTSAILPRMLASLLSGDKTISFAGCLIQFDIFGSLISTECCLLSAMSYDRYLAICKPLHYAARMNSGFSLQLAIGSWLSGFAAGTITACWVSQQIYCGPNEIDHFFCDYTPLIKLSCSDTSRMVLVLFFFISCIFVLSPFLLTLTTYMCIISTILRIPSSSGKKKAFSTCSSHLIVVTVFYGTLIIVYMLPDMDALHDLNKVFSIFYTVLTPMVNPLIYSLRNKEVKEALRKGLSKIVTSMSICK